MRRVRGAVALALVLVSMSSFARKRGDIPSSQNGIGAASECLFTGIDEAATPFLGRFDDHTVSCDTNIGNPATLTFNDHSSLIVSNSNFAIRITPIAWINGSGGSTLTILEVRFSVLSTNTLNTPTLRTIAFHGNQQFSFVACNDPSLNGFNSSGFQTGSFFYTTSKHYGNKVYACMDSPLLAIPLVDGEIRTQYDGGSELALQEPDFVYDVVNNVTIVDFTTLAPANGSDAVAYLSMNGAPAAILSDVNVLLTGFGQNTLSSDNGLDYSSAGLHYVVVDSSGNRYEGGSVSLAFPNCTLQSGGCKPPAYDNVNSAKAITVGTFQDNVDVSNATAQDANDPLSGCYDGDTSPQSGFSGNSQLIAYRSVWYSLNVQNAGAIAISTDGSRSDTRIDIFNGKPTNASTPVTCDDDYPADSHGNGQQQAKIASFTPPANGTYYIMVSEAAKPTGSVVLPDGDLTPLTGPPYDTSTIPLAASAIVNLQVTTTALAANPTSLTFPAVHVGKSSSALAVKLSATGGSIGSITPQASGDFTIASNGCNGVTLTGSATCTIQLTFKPTADGTRNGTLTVGSNAVIGPLKVSLTGSGYIPQATLNPTTLNFGNEDVNTSSAVKKVSVSNGGDGPLTIASFTTSDALAPFSYTTTCGSTVTAGASCEFDFTFTPKNIGIASATFTMTDDAPTDGSTQTVGLSGTGTPLTVTFGPPPTSFGNTYVNAYSAAQTVTLQNTATQAALAVSKTTLTGPFKVTGTTCSAPPFSLLPGTSCSYTIQFTPLSVGVAAGSLTITDNANTGDGTQSVSLSGTGIDVAITPTRPERSKRNTPNLPGTIGLPLTKLFFINRQPVKVHNFAQDWPTRLTISFIGNSQDDEVIETDQEAAPKTAAPVKRKVAETTE